MTEMVERVAFALRLTAFPNYDPDKHPLHLWYMAAQAAIAAMREPTDEMKFAPDMSSQHDIPSTTEIWQEMIDVALSEKRRP